MPAKQPPEIDSARQLELFDEALDESQPIEAEPLVMNDRRRGSSADVEAPPAKPAGPSETGGERTHANADRVVMRELEEALGAARAAGDNRPAYVVLGSYLGEPGAPSTPLRAHGVSLQQARDGWLRRLETQQKSESTLVGYRVAIDDLLDWSETNGRDILTEPRSSTTCTRTRSERNRRRRATTGASSSCAGSCAGFAGATASPTLSSILMRRPSLARSATG